ncbi:MAG: sigma-70 family RNA polymerase sigma factor [Magnetococcales bacterium]|nr:sigma-70 family RNA polymerase sigma factor [Magnetococcales bacterium]
MSESQSSPPREKSEEPIGKNHDQMVIDRVLAGEQKAFELLVRQYQGKVISVIARMVDDPDKVRDLAQETWIKAYRSLPGFRGEAAFFTWLFRIATNTTKNHWLARRESLPLSSLEEEDGTEYVPPQLRDHETPERLLLRKEMLENVQSAMDALVPNMKQAILLRDVRGLSYEEIAQELGCPVGTVRSRIFRGRQEIAQRMQGYLGTGARKR